MKYNWSAFADFLYPREGTETPLRPAMDDEKVIFFIPARGRKQHTAKLAAQVVDDFLYPREGTETLQLHVIRYRLDFLYPREGTETHVSAVSGD